MEEKSIGTRINQKIKLSLLKISQNYQNKQNQFKDSQKFKNCLQFQIYSNNLERNKVKII